MWFIGRVFDEPGARRSETRRAGLVCVKSFGLRLGRTTGTTIAEPLDLAPNHRRQNDAVGRIMA